MTTELFELLNYLMLHAVLFGLRLSLGIDYNNYIFIIINYYFLLIYNIKIINNNYSLGIDQLFDNLIDT